MLYQGEGSATADKEALAEAKRRIAAGEDAAKVRTDTGWKQGAGGEWRSEIDDSKSKLRPGIAQKLLELQAQQQANAANAPIAAAGRHFLGPFVKAGTFGLVDPNDVAPSYKLSDLIDHPELAKAYPGVMDTPVAIDASLRNLGEFQGGNKIALNPRFIQLMAEKKKQPFEDLLREVLVHETQHRIQHDEKWKATRGPSEGGEYEKYRARSEEAEAFDAELRRDLSEDERRHIQPGALEAIDRERERARRREVPSNGAPPEPLQPQSAPMIQRPEASSPGEEAAPATEDAEHNRAGFMYALPGLRSGSPRPITHFLGDHDDEASHAREAYAYEHGFPSYLDMHFALLHPSTPPDVATYHLRAANGIETADSAADNEGEPAR